MSRLLSADLEKRALRTICTSAQGAAMWGTLTSAHFASEIAYKAFKRVEVAFKKRGEVPSWASLCQDPGLDDQTRAALKTFKTSPAKTPKARRELLDSLEVYRKRRGLNEMAKSISDLLANEGVSEIDSIMENVSKKFADIGQAGSGFQTHTIGKGDTATGLVIQMLKAGEDNFIPTGFKAFDAINHGIPLGSLFMISGTSGSGKSAVMNTLSRNFAHLGGKVLFAPLEMDTTSMLQRELAFQTGTSLTNFLNPSKTMTKADKVKALKAYKRVSRKIATANGKITYYSPDGQASIGALLGYSKANGYNIVMIDYVGLLEGTDGDDQVKALGRIASMAKRWAVANRAIVVMAAQLSDDGYIKYARKLKEDASTMWTFQRTPQDRENNTLTVRQEKSRQQGDFPFTLFCDLSTMTIRDQTADEKKRAESASKSGSSAFRKDGGKQKGKKSSAAKFFVDIN